MRDRFADAILALDGTPLESPPLKPAASPEVVRLDIETRDHGAIHRLTVNRPERLNVLDTTALSALRQALTEISENADARAVILQGAGDKAWIGGADIGEMAAFDSDSARAFIEQLHDVCRALRELPVPVLARIHGFCLGAGLEIAACCDLRIASTVSRFGMPEVQVGIPSVIEAALLPRLIGSGRTRDLVLTGRIIDAEVALSWGLVESVIPTAELDAVIEERLTMILSAGPAAIRAQKKLCRQWEELPLTQSIEAGIEAFTDAYGGVEPREYMKRFLDRRRT